jgi:SAM-dependent methyltransferase
MRHERINSFALPVRVARGSSRFKAMNAADWNERYAAEHYFYGEAPNAFLVEKAPYIPAGPVLCLAEGEGRNAVHLATLGHRVTAVDQSEAGLAKARRLAAARGVEVKTVVADLEDFAIESGIWAGIVAVFAHLPPATRRKVHAEAARGLSPGGVFLLEAYTPAQLERGTGGPKSPELLMNLTDLRKELAGLEFLVAREIERDVIEGDGHTGRGAVVQILARRHE